MDDLHIRDLMDPVDPLYATVMYMVRQEELREELRMEADSLAALKRRVVEVLQALPTENVESKEYISNIIFLLNH